MRVEVVGVSITPGWTAEEIRGFVYEYERQPHGAKRAWLAGTDVSYGRLRRWRGAVFDGDLDKGLLPREGGDMTPPPDRRTGARKQAVREAEVERLQARVRELEGANDALGKAIGLLHAKNVKEPAENLRTNDQESS